MINFELNEYLAHITTASGLDAIVYELLVWAQAKDKLGTLLEAAIAANPSNTQLCRFADSVKQSSSPSSTIAEPAMPPLEDHSSVQQSLLVPDWATIVPSGPSRYLPIYLLLDVSLNMAGEPIAYLNQAIEQFRIEVFDDPFTREVVRVGVITYAEKARISYGGLISIETFQSPPLVGSNSGVSRLDLAFEILIQSIYLDVQRYDWRPIIFVFTDSVPTDPSGRSSNNWKRMRTRLLTRQEDYNPPASIVVVGLSPDVNIAVLKEISTGTAFYMGAANATFTGVVQYVEPDN
jgi:uncharacterized protein YegL